MHVVDGNPVLSRPCHLPSARQVLGETGSPPEAQGPPPSPGLAAPSELALAHVSILCSWQVACVEKGRKVDTSLILPLIKLAPDMEPEGTHHSKKTAGRSQRWGSAFHFNMQRHKRLWWAHIP